MDQGLKLSTPSMVTTRSKSIASPAVKTEAKGTNKANTNTPSRRTATPRKAVEKVTTPKKTPGRATTKKVDEAVVVKSTKTVSPSSPKPLKKKASPTPTKIIASIPSEPASPKAEIVLATPKKTVTSPVIREVAKVKSSSPVSKVAATERVRRKKVTPDTAYEKAPKVIPGGAVVCISRLPHGFFESELRAYLSQFGDISRLRLSRSPRTGASRHYAFVEFRHAEVARIVAETMHNYLLAGHLLQCTLMPEERLHPAIWKGANRKFVHIPWRRMEMKRFNSRSIKGDDSKRLIAKKSQELAGKGIEYDLDGIVCEDL